MLFAILFCHIYLSKILTAGVVVYHEALSIN